MRLRATEEQVSEYMAEYNRKMGFAETREDQEAEPGPEGRLQGRIMKWAKDRGYPCQ